MIEINEYGRSYPMKLMYKVKFKILKTDIIPLITKVTAIAVVN